MNFVINTNCCAKKSFTFLLFFYKTGGFGVEKSNFLYKYSQILVINMQSFGLEPGFLHKHFWVKKVCADVLIFPVIFMGDPASSDPGCLFQQAVIKNIGSAGRCLLFDKF